MLMVKPGISYLDIVRDAKNNFPNHILYIYQVNKLSFNIHKIQK